MNDTTTAPAPSVRKQQLDARKERLRAAIPKIERVRVTPANDDIRKYIRHPSGIAFPAEGSVEWPLDGFTKRRLREGSVTREEKREESHERGHRQRPRTPDPA
jgi:hypothetical protein